MTRTSPPQEAFHQDQGTLATSRPARFESRQLAGVGRGENTRPRQRGVWPETHKARERLHPRGDSPAQRGERQLGGRCPRPLPSRPVLAKAPRSDSPSRLRESALSGTAERKSIPPPPTRGGEERQRERERQREVSSTPALSTPSSPPRADDLGLGPPRFPVAVAAVGTSNARRGPRNFASC